jgi:hypothetical protein
MIITLASYALSILNINGTTLSEKKLVIRYEATNVTLWNCMVFSFQTNDDYK